MTRKLSAIFFDVDDTLYSTTEFAKIARENAIDNMIKTGLNISLENGMKELLEVISEFPKNYELHFNKLLSRLGENTYKGINPNLIVAAGIIGYHETKHNKLKIHSDVEEVVKKLVTTKIPMGIITAGLTIKQAEKIIRLGFNKYIDPSLVFITDECGYSKTNPKFYQLAIDRLNVPANEILYIGDSPESDVDPSKAVGMISVLIKRGGKYSNATSKVPPDFTINDFYDLEKILKSEFSLKI
ncbi:MAG: hypothetical protein COA79_11095 [Planctomycetota bacterium]|nr:MAG: hypothetical protein COA79_11095 [Planctomycetota bacterium]